MADAGWRQSISQNIGRKKKKLTKLSFQMHFWGRGKSKMNKFCLNRHDFVWPGHIDNIRKFLALGEVFGFFMLRRSPGDRDLGGSWTLGTRLISLLLQSRESIYLIKFPLSLVFPLS